MIPAGLVSRESRHPLDIGAFRYRVRKGTRVFECSDIWDAVMIDNALDGAVLAALDSCWCTTHIRDDLTGDWVTYA